MRAHVREARLLRVDGLVHDLVEARSADHARSIEYRVDDAADHLVPDLCAREDVRACGAADGGADFPSQSRHQVRRGPREEG